VVEKSKRTLTLMDGRKAVKTYKVALGGQPVARRIAREITKLRGYLFVDAKNQNSQFYKALHLSYPNPADRANAENWASGPAAMWKFTAGTKWGWLGAKHRLTDWTDGCVALTNEKSTKSIR